MSIEKIAIVTDTNSGISHEEAEKLGIYLVAMPFYIDDEEFFEGITIDRETFFAKMKIDADIKTSQPSPGMLIDLWEELLEKYDELIYIPMSGALSSSVNTAKMLAEEYGTRVHVVDNHRISCTQKQSVLEALKMANDGKNALEICDVLHRTAYEPSIYIAVDTLEYLKKGGRITPAGAAIASVLQIKPILQIQGGKLDAFAKTRGKKSAEEKMLKAIENDIQNRFSGKKVTIKGAYTCGEEEAEEWKNKICARFPDHVISLDPLPLSISCHIGEGSRAIVCMPEVDEAKDICYEITE